MRILLSPAKKMNTDTESLSWRDLPDFLPQTEAILARLQSMSYDELQKLWKCNDQIASLNAERFQNMDLKRQLTPSILAYEGIQYQYMAPGVFSEEEYDYIQEHLRILSGFYGMLRPFDGVQPYRLEMQAKLQMGEKKDLYAYWGDCLAKKLLSETDCIVDLASREYSLAVTPHLPRDTKQIRCVFQEEKEGKRIEKGTLCKMARGEMVRFMAENRIRDPEGIKDFTRLDFRFDSNSSDEHNYVFLLKKE